MILRQINAEALAEAESLHLEQTCDMMEKCSLSRHSHTAHPAAALGPLPATDQYHARWDKKMCRITSQPTRLITVLQSWHLDEL